MTRTPVGVIILGFLAFMAGISQLILGFNLLGWVVFGPGSTGNGVVLSGSLAVLVGILYIGVGLAFWSLRPWAWLFGIIMAIFGLFNAVLVAIASGSVSAGLAASLLSLVVLWYLNTEGVKTAFVQGGLYGSEANQDTAQRIQAERSDPYNR
jgi:hypothetical protein